GSEADFLRGLASADLYLGMTGWLNRVIPGEPLSEAPALEHVVHFGLRGGWEDGLGGERVPIFERFLPGGPRSVRGFDYRGLGPELNKVRVGGEAFFQGTAEYAFPVVVPVVRG